MYCTAARIHKTFLEIWSPLVYVKIHCQAKSLNYVARARNILLRGCTKHLNHVVARLEPTLYLYVGYECHQGFISVLAVAVNNEFL